MATPWQLVLGPVVPPGVEAEGDTPSFGDLDAGVGRGVGEGILGIVVVAAAVVV